MTVSLKTSTKHLIALTAIVLLGSSLAQERQTMFNVGSYRLYMACEGAQINSANSSANAPTVLLTTGFGRGSDDLWAKVTPNVAKFARVCRYDRANIGRSDRANGPMTTARIVMDLEKLLEVANVRGPLVTVGQGFGSFTVRAFAAKHSARVAGAVLIEPQPEAFALKSLDVIPMLCEGKFEAAMMQLHTTK